MIATIDVSSLRVQVRHARGRDLHAFTAHGFSVCVYVEGGGGAGCAGLVGSGVAAGA